MKTEQIVEAMATAITEGKIPPGAKLNERDLATIFGVSRTIIRQALGRLQQDGLVSISPKRATTVAKPTIEDAHMLFDAIGMIESAVVERLAKTATKAQITVLRRHVANEAKASEGGDRLRANQLGRGFHEVFVGLLGNHPLTKAHSQLLRQQAVITALFRTEFDYGHLQKEHLSIIDHLERGDVGGVKNVLASHYRLVILGYRFGVEESNVPMDLGEIFAGKAG